MTDDIPRQTFQVKDLPTKTVTLYPSRAHIVREIREVTLKPGQNEIEIFGLGSDVDESSVQIDGQGGASITDLTLELTPNTQIYSDIYPSESELSDSDSDEYEDSDDEDQSTRLLSKTIQTLDRQINEAHDAQLSAERRLKVLDQHANSISAKTMPADKLATALQVYQDERSVLFRANADAISQLANFRKTKARTLAKRKKAGREVEKEKEKLRKDKQRAVEKRMRQRQERAKQAQRVKHERMKFWPHQVYRVTLRLESSIDTPGSSRRNSMDTITVASAGKATLDSGEKSEIDSTTSPSRTISLSMSYVTSGAFWSPRYDLTISSLNKTAAIIYRAEFSNGTSETWRDAKVILSTSQTSYSGLDDKAPIMKPWHVKLGKSYDHEAGGLLSSEEMSGPRQRHALVHQARKGGMLNSAPPPPQASGGLFASRAPGGGGSSIFAAPPQQQQLQQQQMQQMHQQIQERQMLHMAPTPQVAAASISAKPSAFGGFGGSAGNDKVEMKKKSSRMGVGLFGGYSGRNDPDHDNGLVLGSVAASEDEGAPNDGLDFEESVWEDSGLTASYELPGTRTLAPSSLARRHKIASLHATNIHLSYVAVPKLRSAAFLRAKVKNPSNSVTLLKGTAGVTLDGSFLGNMSLPRVSPNQIFSLPLGVDPAIHINYPKPTVHRSTQGIFNKESAHTFSRSVWVTNTKPTAIELLLLDQVPVSQDERLRVDIFQPRGLSKEGDSVKTGQAAKEGSSGVTSTGTVKDNEKWGKAVATLKKGGEITWVVELEKGQAALIKLDYEARLPSGDAIIGA
ncbi:hypothetical protein EJ08DRAFT_663289 [Tothia fuscella]|uniref:DUF4139 domain-containing protein n=1 Tax=Tothia fuscella TaxID=1048955 RepID=A0A9P4TW97_9PEZI|nr:hypothetical protein EJ08DRAFT_663289 [Tothia fuscella]